MKEGIHLTGLCIEMKLWQCLSASKSNKEMLFVLTLKCKCDKPVTKLPRLFHFSVLGNDTRFPSPINSTVCGEHHQ